MSSPLYDLFASVVKKPDPQQTEDFQNLDRQFLSAEVFVSTNVTEYYFAGTDQEFWHLDRDFPNLAPVFDSFWIETKAPTHIRSKIHGVQPWDADSTDTYKRPKRWGAWFINVSSEQTHKLLSEYYKRQHENISPDVSLENCWLYSIAVFVQGEDVQMCEPMWMFSMLVDKTTGQAVRNPNKASVHDPFMFVSYPAGSTHDQLKALTEHYGHEAILDVTGEGDTTKAYNLFQCYEAEAISLLKPLLLALSFLHCRNVSRTPVYPSHKLNKKRQSRNLPPQNKFYTLDIEPMRKIIQQALDEHRGKKGASGIEMAMHRVRGHFKTYTPEKPLLGHAVGSWFWGSIERGSKKRGTITKRYEVKP